MKQMEKVGLAIIRNYINEKSIGLDILIIKKGGKTVWQKVMEKQC